MYKPLILYAISIFIGCISAFLFLEKVYIGIFINIGLLIIFYKKLEKEDFINSIIFIIIGFLAYYTYFNFKVDDNIAGRIVNINNNEVMAVVKKRKIILEGNNTEKLRIGDIFISKGRYIKDVDYKNGVLGRFNICKIDSKDDVLSNFYNVKNKCYEELAKYDKEIANFVMAISLGDKSFLDYDKKNMMNTLGIVHIITVSGFHIALIYKVIETITNYKIGIMTTFVYITIIGYTASTVRAFIMICVFVMSKRVYRNYDSLSSLALAFIILISMKPYYILNSAFNLSFLSVLGIITMKSRCDELLNFLPNLIKDSVSITLSASMFTMLYMAYNFKKINLNGIVANFLLMPFYSLLIVVSNLILIFIYIPKLNNIFIYLLKGMLLCTNTFENFLGNNFNNVYNINYIGALTITSMYISYVLYKKKYKNIIFIPLIMMFFTLVNIYSYYPNVSYIKTSKGTIVNLNYKMNNIIISNTKVKASKIKESIKVDKIYDDIKNKKNINLSDKYNIVVKNNGKDLDIIIDDKILLTKNNKNILEHRKKYRDIKIVKDNSYIRSGCIYDKYKIINKNAFQIYY